MKPLFVIPFATGIFHSIAIKNKKEKQWDTTMAILGTISMYSTLKSVREEYFLKPEHQKIVPSKVSVPTFLVTSFFVASVHSGAFFCLGHLLTKKAYPVFADE